ncbi:hypothetical protein SHKM778_87320 [Streptomyces sp. KM77-8]|uniref:Replication initiation protein n=1 Tax=Streptomyces haneummycinicus TaxID=3074435 RepID=A0AAT9HXU7_9ACTN
MHPTAPAGAIRQLASLARHGDLSAYAHQIQRLGGCERPVRMEGHRLDVHAATGEIVRDVVDRHLPAGQLLIRCNNRRATRCATCAEVYRKDTFHLVTAGLSGGKGIGPSVAQHPRVFATFTAPSFGPVHNRPGGGRCRCKRLHADDDPALGTPLDPDRYDYRAAVLWNAHAGALWGRFTTYLRQQLASRAGIGRSALRDCLKVSYAKVAEYQRRGAVHFHAVIRLDGPDGAEDTRRPGPRPNSSPTRSARRPASPRPPAPSSTATRTPSASASNSTSAPSARPTSRAPRNCPAAPWPPTSPSTPPRAPRPRAPSTGPSVTRSRT